MRNGNWPQIKSDNTLRFNVMSGKITLIAGREAAGTERESYFRLHNFRWRNDNVSGGSLRTRMLS